MGFNSASFARSAGVGAGTTGAAAGTVPVGEVDLSALNLIMRMMIWDEPSTAPVANRRVAVDVGARDVPAFVISTSWLSSWSERGEHLSDVMGSDIDEVGDDEGETYVRAER